MDGIGSQVGSLKRPWPFETWSFEPSEGNADPEPGAISSQFLWDINSAWDQSYLDPVNAYPGLARINQETPYEQDSYSHVTVSSDSFPARVYETNAQTSFAFEENQEVCFGSVIDVKAQLKNTNLPQGYAFAQATAPFRDFQVVPDGGYYSLEYYGNKFAVLNKKTCGDFQAVLQSQQVRLHAYVEGKEWSETVKLWQKYNNSTIITVEINIYGAREIADEVGKVISTFGTFLQQPRYGLYGVGYYNPHYFRVPGFENVESLDTPIITIEEPSSFPIQSAPPDELADPSREVSSILDSLSHHDFLKERAADVRIRRPLLSHQMEAIDFIFRRETGQLPATLRLWRYNDSDSDEPFYQHVFSGAKRSQPDEAKGGILADDMGLGKTLVTLASIAGSIDRAENFVLTESKESGSSQQPSVPSKATLIVAPSSLLLDSWCDEIHKHIYPGDLTFHKHHGQGRESNAHKLYSSDIVLTTYATVASEFCRGRSALAKVRWFRIVLDESHDVRNRSTKQFQAIASLEALHRWCLTGTPIQNSLEDLGALVTFLKVPILENASTFRKHITNQSMSNSRDRFSNLRILLGATCLRRTRALLNLPEPIPEIRRLYLTPSEQAEYDEIVLGCKKAIDMAVSGHKRSRLNSTMLESLLKLRLFCNNGGSTRNIETGPTGLPSDLDEALSYLQQNDQANCIYCTGPIYSINNESNTDGGIWIKTCIHLVCRSCLPQHRANKQICPCTSNNKEAALLPGSYEFKNPSSPSSGGAEDLSRLQKLNQNTSPTRSDSSENQYPSKLLAFLDDIKNQKAHKSIVFSSWKKTLTLVGKLLASHSIPFYCIDGSLPLSERGKELAKFRSPVGANVLLMTLGTGAVGLNLAVASRIYLLEPQWNPAIELQAIGRALRLGQKEQVTIVRYIMRNTVEDSNVLSRQKRKLKLAGGGFSQKGGGLSFEVSQSLKSIFGVDI